MPISFLEYLKQGSYVFLIFLTIYLLFRYFTIKKIGLNTYSLILAAVMYSRQNISINLNSIWAEDGLYFADLKMGGFSSILSTHNGYQQIAYRLIIFPATFLPIKILPIFIMMVCFGIYFILIREMSKSLSHNPVAKLAPFAIFAFIWLPLSPYEALGNINNLATYLLIAFSIIHISLCYQQDVKVIRYTPITQMLALVIGFSSPAFFVVIGFAFLLIINKEKRLGTATYVYFSILSLYNFIQFIRLTESRFEFTFQMLPQLFLDSAYRLVLSPIAGKLMPDLASLFQLRNAGLVVIFLFFFLNAIALVYFERDNIFRKKSLSSNLNLLIALFILVTPSLMAQLNAQSYLLLTDQYYRLALLAPGKFTSVSFFWIFCILFSSQYLFHLKSGKTKKKGKIGHWGLLPQYCVSRVLPVISISTVLFLVLLNSHSTGGRMPSRFIEDVNVTIRKCNSSSGLSLTELPISPYDGNWKIRMRCELLK
jgi:hypothetical protein